MISFFVPGVPKPGGSKRAFFRPGMKHPVITDASGQPGRDWRAVVKDCAMQAIARPPSTENEILGFDPPTWPLEGALKLAVTFQMVRPKGHFRSGKHDSKLKPSAPDFPTGRPDATKLTRSLEDALTGILWRDDAQIVEQVIRKRYADQPGARVTVYRV